MLENKKTQNGIHYSRYIQSWIEANGRYFDERFEAWLKSEGLNEEEIDDIREMAMMGKMELEMSAKRFIRDYVYEEY